MKKWIILASIPIVLIGLALSVNWWLPPLLDFIETNTDLIQGTADLFELIRVTVQIVTAIVTIAITALGVRQVRQGRQQTTISVEEGGTLVVDGDLVVADAKALWRRIGKRFPPEELSLATGRYLAHLVDRYRYLDFRGMGISDRVPLRLPLVEMYVPLKARVEMPKGDTWARELQLAGRQVSEEEMESMGSHLSEPTPVLDLIRDNAGLIILGDPGAGKTTFLKYLALRLAAGQGEGLELGARLPILIPLSAYANALEKGDLPLDDFIVRYYKNRGIELPLGQMLDEALVKGAALLLLDGLDEVRDLSKRHLVVERVKDFFAFRRPAGNKFILTSRIVGYREVRPTIEGLAECTLVDFEDEEISRFVEQWTRAVERAALGNTTVAAQEAERERAELLEAVRHNQGVRQLAANPLLLTILALMKRQGVTLPERRVELYQKYVETLLKHWNLARGLDRPPSRDLDVVETVRVLAPLALWMHQTSPGVGLVKREDVRRKLEAIYTERQIPEPEKAARQLLADAHDYASLLLERGAGEYGFIHLTFQEYLAAVAIAQKGQEEVEPVVKLLADHVGDDNWHEVSLLTIGYLGIVQQRDEAAGKTLQELIKASPGEPGQAVVLAGEAVLDAWPGGVTQACKAEVVKYLKMTMVADDHVKPPVRAASGKVLAQIGDPRFRPTAWYLPQEPPLGFYKIPAGPFLMGEGKEEHLNKWLDYDYWMARYPVTVAQFRAFVKESGYQAQGSRERYAEYENHPASAVTWHEAVAYGRWLTEQLREREGIPDPLAALLRDRGWIVRLPSEAEWEKAARGTDGRVYPWGKDADPNRANYGDTGIGSTSAVGCFPGGVSVYGCEDMSGNVWEWTSSLWKDYPYDPRDGREDLKASGSRVLRGGAFYSIVRVARCAFRSGFYPVGLYRFPGFRVVVAPSEAAPAA